MNTVFIMCKKSSFHSYNYVHVQYANKNNFCKKLFGPSLAFIMRFNATQNLTIKSVNIA